MYAKSFYIHYFIDAISRSFLRFGNYLGDFMEDFFFFFFLNSSSLKIEISEIGMPLLADHLVIWFGFVPID